jgi:hypothetical protein
LLKLLAAFHRLAQLLGARAGHPFGVILAIFPNLMLVIRAQRVAGIGSLTKLALERAVLHLVDLGHLLEDHLTLLDEFAHGQTIVYALDIFKQKMRGKSER